ncbi:hypothetical protein [Kribbella sp. VKM Ac-2568]|uniref:hypothetical protein n=1 Tax=Kribbella sp. VKM Ac-2568 TaxID=2512219 RepID=UPI00104C0C8D|nr:hypothetical protein [Kribbella sp. VKM Ac-2568]TCM45556.1 hypothetical protein EV648_10617 [Kribbella sp. VKM Ac-2568]
MTAPGDAWSDAALIKALAHRAPVEASAQLFIRHASTGAKPILAVADNGKSYWLKWPDNPHGSLSLAHKMIVAQVGQLIGAPVRPVALIHVDPALVEDYYIGGERPVAGTFFASELLHDVEEHTTITRVARDGNSHRFPHYLALWDLCLGTDLQLLYHLTEHHQVWSIDHGLWFDSLEADWSPDLLAERVDKHWPWPEEALPAGLDGSAFRSAADAVDGLTGTDLANIMGSVPLESGVSDQSLRALAMFIHARRPTVSQRLRESADSFQ